MNTQITDIQEATGLDFFEAAAYQQLEEQMQRLEDEANYDD